MTRTEALRGAVAFTLPAALVISGSLATLAVIGNRGYQSEASPPRPSPTVTVTTPAVPPVAQPSAEPSVGATKTLMPAGPVPVRGTADRPVAAQRTSPGRGTPPQTPVPGGSSPAPGTGSHSAGCTKADLSLCLRLGIATSRTLTTGGRR